MHALTMMINGITTAGLFMAGSPLLFVSIAAH